MLDASALPPTLETKRLTLRPLREGDIGLLSLYSSDLRVSRMTTSIPHPNPPGAVEQFVARETGPAATGLTWAIDATRGFGTEVIGVITLRPDGELGYWLGPFFWGLGVMSEAVLAVVDHADSAGFAQISACAFDDNPASQRVLEKAGLVECGVKKAFSVSRGEAVRSLRYARKAQA